MWTETQHRDRHTYTQTHTGKALYEHENDGRNASESQGIPKIARKHPETRVEAWDRFILTVLRKKKPIKSLISWTLHLLEFRNSEY